jgi:flavin-dependent dehydrogenase
VTFAGERTDLFVIGGGPSGLAAAIAARLRGFAATVADGGEPPIDKVCGEGMMPETQAALAKLGVKLPAGAGYRFRGIRFIHGDTQVEAEFPEGRGVGIRRTQLHEALIQEAQRCGVKLLWKTPVVGIESDGVRLNDETVAARWIVGADGGHSRVRRWSQLDRAVTKSHRMANRRHYHVRNWSEYVEIYWGLQVQAYVTPIAKEEVCIVTMGETARDTEFERALEVLPRLEERLVGAELCSRTRGAISATHSLARVWRGNVALVGDASGSVDAITGEGLRLAFRQALALAEAVRGGDLRPYGRVHQQLAQRPLWMARLLLQLGRLDGMRSRVLSILSRNPELFSRLLAVHVGRATAGDLVAAGAQLGWQVLAS